MTTGLCRNHVLLLLNQPAMRKILLLTVIGGLGFAPQITGALNVVSQSIAIEYLCNHHGACMMPCADIAQESAGLVSRIAPLNICTKIILKNADGRSMLATKIFRGQGLIFPPGASSAGYTAFIPGNVNTVTPLHFNRMVNRKRILLSG